MTKINLEYYSQIIKLFILKHRIYILLLFLFFDGIYGLRFNAGIFSFGNIISGESDCGRTGTVFFKFLVSDKDGLSEYIIDIPLEIID